MPPMVNPVNYTVNPAPIIVTPEHIRNAFKRWETEARLHPHNFRTRAELVDTDVNAVSQDAADYFLKLLTDETVS